jgi:Plasmid encoded RepA protein
MLVHASACLRELVPSAGKASASSVALRKVDAIELVRQKRSDGTQDIAFGARPFVLCGLPIRSLPDGTLRYSRRNGRFFLEIIGHPDYGVPFGQDRLIPLWIASQAVRQQTRTVEFENAGQILHEWGLAQNGAHYRRLADGFRRIFASTICFGTSEASPRAEVWDCGRLHFFERMRLWFRPDSSPPQPGQRNLVTLSEAFWEEIRAHPVPIDAEVVRALANNPGCLDLYTWLSWRCYQARTEELIPLFGEFGLASQLGVQEYERERKFRERVRRWLELVRLYWPDCPATVSANGQHLELGPATALHRSTR